MNKTLTRILQAGIAGTAMFLGTSCASTKNIDTNLIRSEAIGNMNYSSYKDGRTVVMIDDDGDGRYDFTLTHKKAGEADYRKLEWSDREGGEFCFEVSTQGAGWDKLTRISEDKTITLCMNRSDPSLYSKTSMMLNKLGNEVSIYELGRQTEKALVNN